MRRAPHRGAPMLRALVPRRCQRGNRGLTCDKCRPPGGLATLCPVCTACRTSADDDGPAAATRSSPTAMAAATCRLRWCCPTAPASRCRQQPDVDIVARSLAGPEGARLARRMGSLARAYVHGDIDFTGSARRVLAIAESMVGDVAHGRDRALARWQAVPAPAPQQPRATSRTTTTSPTRSTACGSTSAWSTPAPISGRRATRSTQAQVAEARPHLPQAAPRAGRALSRHRLRLGRRSSSTRPRTTACDAHGHHAVAQPVRARARARSRARGLAGRVRVELRDYLDLPDDAALRQDRERGHVRARRRRAASRSTSARSTASSSRAAWCSTTASRTTARRRQPRQRHRRVRRGIRVSRAASSPTCRSVIEGMAARGPRGRRRRSAARALREDAVALGRAARGPRRRGPAPRWARRSFRVWRIYMAGSAHAFDRGWLSLWQVLAGKPLPGRPAAASADPRVHVRARRLPGASADRCIGRRRPLVASRRQAAYAWLAAHRSLDVQARSRSRSTPCIPKNVSRRSLSRACSRSRSWAARRTASRRPIADVVRKHAPGLRPGDARDARVEAPAITVGDRHGQRHLARAARRPVPRLVAHPMVKMVL